MGEVREEGKSRLEERAPHHYDAAATPGLRSAVNLRMHFQPFGSPCTLP